MGHQSQQYFLQGQGAQRHQDEIRKALYQIIDRVQRLADGNGDKYHIQLGALQHRDQAIDAAGGGVDQPRPGEGPVDVVLGEIFQQSRPGDRRRDHQAEQQQAGPFAAG